MPPTIQCETRVGEEKDCSKWWKKFLMNSKLNRREGEQATQEKKSWKVLEIFTQIWIIFNFDGIYFSQLLNAKLNEAASIHPHSLFVQLYYIPCLIRAISFIIPFRVHETRSEFFIFLSSPSFAREMIQKQEGISTTTLNSRWICINCCWNLFSEQQQASLLIEKNLSSSFLSHTHERARVLFYHHPTVMMPKASERGDSEESCKWIPLCEQDKQQSHCIVLQPTRDESFFYFAMQFKLSHVPCCLQWMENSPWMTFVYRKKKCKQLSDESRRVSLIRATTWFFIVIKSFRSSRKTENRTEDKRGQSPRKISIHVKDSSLSSSSLSFKCERESWKGKLFHAHTELS